MSTFHFKEFSVNQLNASMKVGTDAMLLGALIDASGKNTALDIGTGTGVLSLMVAQKNPLLQIEAVDIDEINVELASTNFQSSRFSSSLKVKQVDFLEYSSITKFDLIFTNPPYYEDGLLNPNDRKANARHEQSLPIEKLIDKSITLLKDNGDFWMIIPSVNKDKWISFSERKGLFLRRLYLIEGKKNVLNRVVLNFNFHSEKVIEEIITIRDSENNFTDQYKALTKDYHGVKL